MATNHSPHFKDLTGQQFHRLLVLRFAGLNKHRRSLWLCRCECERRTKLVVLGAHLLRKKDPVKSCGCWRRELPQSRVKHGQNRVGKRSPEYTAWAGIKDRCTNPSNKRYMNYGGIGIMPCARWRDSFEAFLEDMGKRPSRRHSIERVDNSKGYTCGKCPDCLANGYPANCTWALPIVQANNTRKNVFVTFRGKRQTIAQWARELGIKPDTLCMRITVRKMPIEKALTIPPRKVGILTSEEKRNRLRARWAVRRDVRSKRLPHPTELPCDYCGEPAEHYHHHAGYEREHWLDVLPICDSCHRDCR